MKNLILLIISTTLLSSCNEPKKEEKQSTKEEQPIQNEQTDFMDKSVSLSVKPDIFKLSGIPEEN